MVILGGLLVFAALAVFAFGKRSNSRDVEFNEYKKPLLSKQHDENDVLQKYRA